jgi:hypothetical protein
VFGCSGATDVIAEALEWAVDNDMDVVNMSLGADFTTADSADALAADNAVKAGIVVVSAAGNAGDIRYAVGAPGASTRGIAVAASAKERYDGRLRVAGGSDWPGEDHHGDQRQRRGLQPGKSRGQGPSSG